MFWCRPSVDFRRCARRVTVLVHADTAARPVGRTPLWSRPKARLRSARSAIHAPEGHVRSASPKERCTAKFLESLLSAASAGTPLKAHAPHVVNFPSLSRPARVAPRVVSNVIGAGDAPAAAASAKTAQSNGSGKVTNLTFATGAGEDHCRPAVCAASLDAAASAGKATIRSARSAFPVGPSLAETAAARRYPTHSSDN